MKREEASKGFWQFLCFMEVVKRKPGRKRNLSTSVIGLTNVLILRKHWYFFCYPVTVNDAWKMTQPL